MDERAEALLALIAAQQGLSAARACKRLGLSRSELQRLLTRLGPQTSIGGLGLVRIVDDGERETLWLAKPADEAHTLREPHGARGPLAQVDALRLAADESVELRETLAEETPVALLYNGVPHVVMMATPADLEDFAVGFSLTEGIVGSASQIEVIEVLQRERGLAVHLAIPSARFEALQERRRSLVGRTGCGLCGAEALESAVRAVRQGAAAVRVSRDALSAAFARLAAMQPLNDECGALHAAAAMIGGGLLVREDVGRHNALDKVVGALARGGLRADALLVTSRASYELVHKTAEAGVPLLAAVSAPTAYAVRLAREAGLTLVAFAREGRMTVYAGAVGAER